MYRVTRKSRPALIVCLPRIIATLGCRLRTVVGSKVIFDDALPSVVAPAIGDAREQVLLGQLAHQRRRPAPLRGVEAEVRRADQLRPVGERRAHVEDRARD